MLSTAVSAARHITRNWITSLSGTVAAASTTAHTLGMTLNVPVSGHQVDLVIVGVAAGGAVFAWAAKDANNHSTQAEVQAATAHAALPGGQP